MALLNQHNAVECHPMSMSTLCSALETAECAISLCFFACPLMGRKRMSHALRMCPRQTQHGTTEQPLHGCCSARTGQMEHLQHSDWDPIMGGRSWRLQIIVNSAFSRNGASSRSRSRRSGWSLDFRGALHPSSPEAAWTVQATTCLHKSLAGS